MAETEAPCPAATKQQIVERVRTLVPDFGKRAEAAEEARRIPAESARELIDAGIARILVPRRFGGYELGLETWVEVVREISKADASHGWCASLMIHHPHYVAQCSEEAQQAVWADGANVAIAASVLPVTQVHPKPGGYRISGTSPFASGIGHSSWAFVGGMVEAPGGPEWTLFLIPPGEYKVADTWFTAGMRATGSNSIVTESVFVPESRTIRVSDLREGKGPGGALHDAAIYRAPIISYAPLTFVTPMLGAAQGAYEMFREWTRTRQATGGGAVADIASVQTRLARTAASLDAAELLLRRALDAAQTATPPSLEVRARSMRDFSRAAEFSMEAIDTLLSMSGTAGFAASHPVQRAWRDIHFASMHTSLNPERNYGHFGRMELGLPRDPRHPFF
jgi:3-hydroxy-9,10-secoandrosta-1,3,5(10)-triene-9,17-dione monooxygenase